MRSSSELASTLDRIDGRGYKAYRDLIGSFAFDAFDLFVDRVQADPFASPSRIRVRVRPDRARLPDSTRANPIRRTATEAYLARRIRTAIRSVAPRREGTGKSGLIQIDAGGPEVLERTAVLLAPDCLEARLEIGLPAKGRRVFARAAETLLLEALPEIVFRAWIDREDPENRDLLHFVDCIENQESVRAGLEERGLVAFVGNGARLPRESGASERPMPADRVVAFESPQAFVVDFEVPNENAGMQGRRWVGMGIPRGVVLLVGGGYHGKSTLLQALERCVVPHEPGDGRETVVSAADLVKIRAEDGRSVRSVELHGFIGQLPRPPGVGHSPDPRSFSTDDASGSTSQATNIVEAIEAGATGLLLDEDTSATNFMVRDARMQALVHPQDEPITPFRERVRELFESHGISTVLVMGGSGDYFELADAVIELDDYRPIDVTRRAREIASSIDSGRGRPPTREPFERPRPRIPEAGSFDARRGRKAVSLSSRGCEEIVFGTTEIDLRAVEQLVDPSQTRAIAAALHLASRRFMNEDRGIGEILDALEAHFDREGLDGLDPDRHGERREPNEQDGRFRTGESQPRGESRATQSGHPGNFARPRRFEIAAALNRMRSLRIRESMPATRA